MALDPRIILAGQTPNYLATMGQASQAAGMANEVQRNNALADMYRTQGAGILAGEQGAMNALAGLSPQAAIGMQQTQLGMQNTQQTMQARTQQMGRLSAQEQRAVETHAASMSTAERQQAIAATKQAVAAGLALPDAQTWDAHMQQNGQPDLVGQFPNREAVGARFLSIADALERFDAANAPPKPGFNVPAGTMLVDPNDPRAGVEQIPGHTPKPADEYARYVQEEAAAGRKPLDRIGFAQAKKGKGITVYDPETGMPSVQIGGDGRPTTDKPKKDHERIFDAESGSYEDRVIRGSPTWNDLIDKSQKTRRSMESFVEKNDLMVEDIGRAIALAEGGGLPATGLSNALTGAIPGTPAYRLNKLILGITSNVAFDFLADMRANSPTGGAVGQLSDSERVAMAAIFGDISGANESGDLVYNLRRLRDVRTSMQERMGRAYNEDFAQVGMSFGAKVDVMDAAGVTGATDAEIMAIKPADLADMSPEAVSELIKRLEALDGK